MPVKPFRDDLGWRWQLFAGRWMLVTDGGGQQVILSGKHQAALQTRDAETGLLRDLKPSDQVAEIIAGAADVCRHAQALINGVSLGLVRIESNAPAKAGRARSAIDHDKDLQLILLGLIDALAKSGGA